MNYLQNYTREEFDKHLHNKYIESLKYMQIDLTKNIKTNNFDIRKSTIAGAGNGLFTNIDIKKNDIVCYYPPVIIWDHTTQNIIHNFDNFDINNLNNFYTSDYVYTSHKISIIGFKDTIINNDMYLGHIANDNNYNPKKIYSNNKNNCVFKKTPFELTTDSFKDNKSLALIATRDIKIDDEIFVTYGKEYWYGSSSNELSRHLKIKQSLS